MNDHAALLGTLLFFLFLACLGWALSHLKCSALQKRLAWLQEASRQEAIRREVRPLEFAPPNLDCVGSVLELDRLQTTFAVLQWYCKYKAEAMILRRNGNIPAALNKERECEVLYETLPHEWRW